MTRCSSLLHQLTTTVAKPPGRGPARLASPTPPWAVLSTPPRPSTRRRPPLAAVQSCWPGLKTLSRLRAS